MTMSLEPKRVLVVDDDPIFCEILSKSIELAGLGVERAPGVAGCLRWMDEAGETGQPAAMLVDLFMPHADGFDLMRALGARKCKVPLIVVTGVGQEYLRAASEFGRAWGLNILDTMMKPLEIVRLRGHLDALRAPTRTAARRLVVLVVDDDEDVRALPVAMLAAAGYEVLEAANGLEALDQIRARQDVDVLFTDLDMPEMNGIELAIVAERLRPSLKVIFCSGKIATAPVANALFLAKPYHRAALLRIVDTAIAG